ncbi:hypothetical protein [Streptomyces sp. MB09-02B]|uniref:hypothetical protein n=1 Tax=Streptomyces sp. MB09-02B TaxID=3028667 RepID=UPI0029B2C4E4|nr:hypothetical protein [Streptomyces sp. MB09-02B]MDX3643229.1 hypothetical protein [Streptomyces sp. MB09-02B]
MSLVKPPMWSYQVVISPPGMENVDAKTKDIRAAYFQAEDGFTVFKNDEHQSVFAVRADCLFTVERTAN